MRKVSDFCVETIMLFFFLSSLSAYGQSTGLDAISRQEITEQIEYLASDSLAGRQAGSAGGRLAADYIVRYLQRLGIKPLDGSYRHTFKSAPFNYVRYGAGIRKDGADADYKVGNDLCNLMAVMEGKSRDDVVIVGAHYDHVGSFPGLLDGDFIYNGADDNASGTVAVMQIAKAFASLGERPNKTMVFAFWDGEERNCKGSEYFVKNNPLVKNIRHCVNLDMVGRGVADSIACICSDDCKEKYIQWIGRAVKSEKVQLDVTTESEYTVYDSSDQRPFAEAGIPCLWFFSGEHEDVHTPKDEVSKLNIRKIEDVAKAAFYVLRKMCE